MASSEQTTKRHLNKPQPEDFVNVINDICDNMDNLDDAVPDSRKVNGHALNADVTVSKSDVGLGNVDNVQQVPATRKVNNKPLSSDINLQGTDIQVSSSDSRKVDAAIANCDNETASLKSALNDLSEIDCTLEENKFVRYSNGATLSYNGINIITANVAEGMTIHYNITIAVPDYRGLAFYNDAGAFISGVQMLAQKQTIAVPTNAKTLKASVNSASDVIIVSNNKLISNIVNAIKENIADINELEDANSNLYDYTGVPYISVTANKFVNCTTGEVGAGSYSYSYATDYIAVIPSVEMKIINCMITDHTIEAIVGLAFYDNSKSFISGISYTDNFSGEFAVPNNATYIRLTVFNAGINKYQIVIKKGDVVSETANKAEAAEEAVHEILDSVIRKTSALSVAGKFVNCNTGVVPETGSYNFSKATDYIDVVPYSTLTIDHVAETDHQIEAIVGMAFYNANKGFISGVSYAGLTFPYVCQVPKLARYARFTIYYPNESNYFIIENLDKSVNTLYDNELSPELLTKITDTIGFLSIFRTVGCIGDSLSSGVCMYKVNGQERQSTLYDFSWGQFLARKTNNKYYNFSAGGLSAGYYAPWLETSYATQCYDGEHLCDAYFIGLGQNDANYIREHLSEKDAYIGTINDINLSDYTQNANTYYGNYGKIIQKIKEVQPKAKIFIFTDPIQYVEDLGLNDAVRAIANIFDNVYLLDMYDNAHDIYFTTGGIINSAYRGGHYNAYAYEYMSRIIANYVDWIVRNNLSEFNQVEFIGTDYSW